MNKILDSIACIVIILVLGIFALVTIAMLFIDFTGTIKTLLGWAIFVLVIWAAIRVGEIMSRRKDEE